MTRHVNQTLLLCFMTIEFVVCVQLAAFFMTNHSLTFHNEVSLTEACFVVHTIM
jgi:hypothetical protein